MVCVVYCVDKWRRVVVYSIPELELQLNSNSNLGIGIEIGGIENGIEIENSGIGIENQNYFFATAITALTSWLIEAEWRVYASAN